MRAGKGDNKRNVMSVFVSQFCCNFALSAAVLTLVMCRTYLGQAVYGYDAYMSSLCALITGQLGFLICWNSLLEPRSATRWLLLFVVSILSAATAATVFYFCDSRFLPSYKEAALCVFTLAVISMFGIFLVGRIFTWPLAHWTSFRLEYERTPVETTTPQFSLREYMCWISAVAAMLWYARSVFENHVVRDLVLETTLATWLVAVAMGIILSIPVIVCAMLLGLRRSWSRLMLLVLAVLLTTLGEVTVAWYVPVSWEVFAWSTLLYNVLVATTVFVNFSILEAIGVRLVRTSASQRHHLALVGRSANSS